MARWSDRWKKVHKPLFNGYVFTRVTEQGRRKIFEDPGTIYTIFCNGRPARIRNEEMEAMQFLIFEGSNIKMIPLNSDIRVIVTEGSHVMGIVGLEGVVLKIRGNQVSLRIESLQSRLSIMVPRHMLARFEPLCLK